MTTVWRLNAGLKRTLELNMTEHWPEKHAAAGTDDIVSLPRSELLRLAASVSALARRHAVEVENAPEVDRSSLVDIADRIIKCRRNRSAHFSSAMFGEPAWDIYLALYVAEGAGESVSIGQAAEMAGVPQTSAKRWIEYLEKEHLVVRRAHDSDARRALIGLTQQGREELDAYHRRLLGSLQQLMTEMP